jgi:1,4-dihydroxy-2-naphthoate octaprenyltransferase
MSPSAAHPIDPTRPPRGWRLWWMAVRPRTLGIAVAPVLAGAGLAWARAHGLEMLPLAATLLGALLIQAGTNLWNDVGDALRGGDRPQRVGPPRVTALGWASPRRVRHAALLCFAAAALVGIYLAVVGGWPIVALGGASLLAGWGYSGGPRPISYTPLGEVFVLAFFGIGAVAGTVWLQLAHLPPEAVIVGVAIGLPACGVLMANNYRDMDADRVAGRRTLAIVLGAKGARLAYAAMVLAPFVVLLSPAVPPGGWLGVAALPLALRLAYRFTTTSRGPAFNALLAGTARFQLVLACLVTIGVVAVQIGCDAATVWPC